MNLMKFFSPKKILPLAAVAAILTGLSFEDTALAADKTAQATEGYVFKSPRYNYEITCPRPPVNYIPAKLFFDDQSKKGDVIIFEDFGDIHKVKTAWVILADAFEPDALPDFTKLDEETGNAMLQRIQENNGYVMIAFIDLPNKNKGIYAVTAKAREVDTDNDGKPDMFVDANNQMVVTFFRGQLNGRFCVQLIDNPQLRVGAVEDYQNGLMTFKELAPDTGDTKKKSSGKKKK